MAPTTMATTASFSRWLASITQPMAMLPMAFISADDTRRRVTMVRERSTGPNRKSGGKTLPEFDRWSSRTFRTSEFKPEIKFNLYHVETGNDLCILNSYVLS
eukprot:525679_1